MNGLSAAEARALRDVFTPAFEGSFRLECPQLDESMKRSLKRLKASGSVGELVEKTWLSTHYKVLDIARPLVQLWSQVPPGDAANQYIESALRLWGVAFSEITKNRRKNILRQTAPDYINLLTDPSLFSNRETSRLFGAHFLEAMSKEADEESKIAKVGRSGGPYRRTSRYASKGQRGAYQNNSGGQSSNPNFQPSRGNGHFQRSGSVSFLLASFLESGKKYPPVGGRLLRFVSAWRSVSHDPFILEAVSYGMTIDFVDTPYQQNIPPNCAMSKEMEQACDLEISELLTKHAIVPVLDSSAGFYSSIFLVPKKKGGFRPIINLKRLNSFVRCEHFKLESIESVRHLIRQGDWMVKLDLKDAYLSVPIHVDHQHYLRFSWRGFRYQFTCLPFGLSPAPRLFTKLLKSVVAALCRMDIRFGHLSCRLNYFER